jgi:hypothetical protein
MDQKTLISNVVTAAATAIVMGLGAWALGVFNAGSVAIDEAQIEAVVGKILVRDTGATYAASLASIDVSVAQINTSIGAIKDDIDDLEDSVSILVAE